MAHPAEMASASQQPLTRTMSLEEVRQSKFLTGVDVVLFLSSGICATIYFLESRTAMRALRHRGVDTDSLACRSLFLFFLSVANISRALCLVLDAVFLVLLSPEHAKHSAGIHAWKPWFEYLVSSLPTMVWSTMLSVLLVYIVEVYSRTQLRRATRVRSKVLWLNVVAYVIYFLVAVLTIGHGDDCFRTWTYCLLCVVHVGLALSLMRFGCGLRWQLRQRREAKSTSAGPSKEMIRRISMLSALLPLTELVRSFNDMQYSLGHIPFNLGSGLGSMVFLALMKLALEWVPSIAILHAFRPIQAKDGAAPPLLAAKVVDPLLPPDAGEVG